MKIKMTKVLALSLAAAMATSVFAGCSSGGGKVAKKENHIVFWHIQTEDPQKTIVKDSVDRFMKDNDKYSVEVVPTQNDQYKQKLTLAMSSGETPDMYTHWSGGPMNEYVKAGHAIDLTDRMESVKDEYLDASIEQATYDGKIYAVPMQSVSVAGVFYNKEIYKEYGLKVPTTLAELEANCDTIVSKGKIPFALANATKWTGSMYYMYLATRQGGLEPFNAAVDGSGSFETDSFNYAGQKIQEWVDKKYFNEGVNGMDEDAGQAKALMYKEDAVMQLHGSWMVATYKRDSEDFYNKMGWFPFPSIEGGAGDPSTVVGTIGDNFISISSKDEKIADGAFKLATEYILDDTSIKERIKAGLIPPLKSTKVEDPILQDVLNAVNNANTCQLWYDQYLPPEVSEAHKNESQKLFDKSATPEEVNAAQQKAMEKYLNSEK